MIPKRAIELSIEGGWANYRKEEIDRGGYKIALDPTFWQALGKSLGWEAYVGEFSWEICSGGHDSHSFEDAEWKMWALMFYDLILTGGNTDAYWKELLN